jgi:long-subunit fatty acid transport protein
LGAKFAGDAAYGFYKTESLITLTNLSPALAWRWEPDENIFLSLGATVNVGMGRLVLKSPVYSPLGGVVGSSDSQADGSGIGATFGLIFQNEESAWRSIGVVYQTKMIVDFSGQTDFAVPGMTEDDFDSQFVFPARFGAGITFCPSEEWTLALDLNSFDYSGAKHLKMKYKNLPENDQLLGWRGNSSLHFGTEYRARKNLALRAGTGYQLAAVPEKTLSPLTPDTSGWDITAGLGYQWRNFSLDGSYIYAWGDRTADVSPGVMAPGKYEAKVGVFALGLAYNF